MRKSRFILVMLVCFALTVGSMGAISFAEVSITLSEEVYKGSYEYAEGTSAEGIIFFATVGDTTADEFGLYVEGQGHYKAEKVGADGRFGIFLYGITAEGMPAGGWVAKAYVREGDVFEYSSNAVTFTNDLREPMHDVTQDEMLASGGYTFDYSYGKKLATSNGVYKTISDLDVAFKDQLTEANGFVNDTVLYIQGYNQEVSYVTGLENKFSPDYDYTISFNAYSDPDTTGLIVLMMKNAGAQNSDRRFTRTQVSGNVYNYTLSFNPTAGDDKMLLYNLGTIGDLYVGKFTISAVPHVAQAVTPNGHVVGKTWEIGSDRFFTGGGDKGYVIDTPAEYVGREGFGDKVLEFDISQMPADNIFLIYQDAEMEACGTYKMTVYYAIENTSMGNNYICYDRGDFKQFSLFEAREGVLVIEGVPNRDYVTLHNNNKAAGGKVYIAKIVVELTAIA